MSNTTRVCFATFILGLSWRGLPGCFHSLSISKMDYDMGVKLADDGLDKRRRKSAIRRKAIKFTKIVSLVGIRHATDARNSTPRRFIWVAWLFVGFGFAIYQIQECINNYFDYPSVTEFRIIISEEMLLPQITICNENEIVTTKSKDLGRPT